MTFIDAFRANGFTNNRWREHKGVLSIQIALSRVIEFMSELLIIRYAPLKKYKTF